MAGRPAPEDVRREQILRAAYDVAVREGLGGLTLRAVAAEADLSHALVLFYFKRKEGLVRELLEWLISNTPPLDSTDESPRSGSAMERLHRLLQREIERVLGEPGHTRLFFEYWAFGARHPAVRARIGEELERYRAAFRAVMEELLVSEPSTFPGATADGMAAVAVSWIHGCAVQALSDPDHFDTAAYLATARGMVSQLARSGVGAVVGSDGRSVLAAVDVVSGDGRKRGGRVGAGEAGA
jgi:TetR/AcrR family transcriptional regulator, transcriptional repressor of bet genes